MSDGDSPAQRRLYPERPFLAASIAVFRGDRVLLAARTAAPFDQIFSLPGGVVELGETLEQAALRELEEETGVRAAILQFNGHVEFLDRDEAGRVRRHFVIASFVGRWISGEGAVGPEAAAILWADAEETSRLRLTPGLAPLLAKARRALEAAS
jgi:ADP-ribose pyrophosphatase YjhB (NUDIX family)